MWLIWAANFDGCPAGLDRSGGYGFNYQELRLTLTKSAAARGRPSLRPPGRLRG